MASNSTPHSSLVRAAAAEGQRIERALTQLDQQRTVLTGQLAHIDRQVRDLEDRRQLLAQLVGDAAPTRAAEAVDHSRVTLLRGRELRLAAARLLWAAVGDTEIHYREWLERFLEEGYVVGGKDAAATFLTNVRDSPAVVRGSRAGFYRLDPAAVARADRDVGEAQAELSDLEDQLRRARRANETAQVERLRRERDRLTAMIKRLTAQHEELHAVFADAGSGSSSTVALHAA